MGAFFPQAYVQQIGADSGGSGDGDLISYPAASIVSALRVVSLLDEEVHHTDKTSSQDVQTIYGLSITAGNTGTPIMVRRSGIVTDSSWSWTPGYIWLGSSGVLTQISPEDDVCVVVATAVASDTILLLFQDPTFF